MIKTNQSRASACRSVLCSLLLQIRNARYTVLSIADHLSDQERQRTGAYFAIPCPISRALQDVWPKSVAGLCRACRVADVRKVLRSVRVGRRGGYVAAPYSSSRGAQRTASRTVGKGGGRPSDVAWNAAPGRDGKGHAGSVGRNHAVARRGGGRCRPCPGRREGHGGCCSATGHAREAGWSQWRSVWRSPVALYA